MTERVNGSPADYLAAERTFLAWIRTGLALMGFGFVVARFGLFLQALQIGKPALQSGPYGPSFWFGIALIVLGVGVNVVSARTHVRLVRALQRGEFTFAHRSSLAIAVAAILAILGAAMAVYVVLVHEPKQARLQNTQEQKSMTTSTAQNGIEMIPGHQSVEQTVDMLQGMLKAKGIERFALIDHSGEAEKAGMKMRPTKLLVFGNPKADTPLMIAAPSIAIDLPLKIPVWEDADGKVWVSYNSRAYLQARHGLPQDLLQNIAMVEALATKAAE